jgi:hypothetical protein
MPPCMLRKLCISLIVVACAVGCGGGGGGGSSTPSPFAGQWAGTYTSPGNDGTLGLTVGNNGSFTGNVHDNGADADGTFNGSVNNNGGINATVHYSGSPDTTVSGTVTINGSGHMVGNLTQNFGGGVTDALDVDLAPQ